MNLREKLKKNFFLIEFLEKLVIKGVGNINSFKC